MPHPVLEASSPTDESERNMYDPANLANLILPVSPCRGPTLRCLENEKELREKRGFYRRYIAILGQRGIGRNTLAWRLGNIADSQELPVELIEFSVRHPERRIHRVANISITQSGYDFTEGVIELHMRMVPPWLNLEGVNFFMSRQELSRPDGLLFCFDTADPGSVPDMLMLMGFFMSHAREMPPFLLVGTKADLRTKASPPANLIPVVWSKCLAEKTGARGFKECSALANDDECKSLLEAVVMMIL